MGLLVGVEETDDKVDLQKKFIGVSIASNKENNILLHFPTSQKKKKKKRRFQFDSDGSQFLLTKCLSQGNTSIIFFMQQNIWNKTLWEQWSFSASPQNFGITVLRICHNSTACCLLSSNRSWHISKVYLQVYVYLMNNSIMTLQARQRYMHFLVHKFQIHKQLFLPHFSHGNSIFQLSLKIFIIVQQVLLK